MTREPEEPREVDYSIDQLVAHCEHLLDSGHADEAETVLRGVLRQLAPVHRTLAQAAWMRTQPDLAIALAEVATGLDMDDVRSAEIRVEILLKARRHQEALALADALVARASVSTNAYVLAGLARLRTNTAGAIEHFERAVEVGPKHAPAWEGLGLATMEAGLEDKAVPALRRVLELAPHQMKCRANLAVALANGGEHAEARALIEQGRGARGELDSTGLFLLNTLDGMSAEEVAEEHRRWGRSEVARHAERVVLGPSRTPGKKRLRVGYLSPDLRAHSVAFFMLPIIVAHDRDAVEVVLYHDDAQADEVTALARKRADGFRSVSDLSDDELFERLRADRVDLLVDLAGHTRCNRLSVFSRRPAPVQVTYLGYPNTTGLGTIDARVTDAFADPPGETEALHTERLVRPFASFLAYAPLASTPEPSSPPVETNGVVTFGSFNARRKVTPGCVALWSRVLAEVPNSRLLLKSKPLDAPACLERLLRDFEAHGIARERVEAVPHQRSMLDHLATYARIDVALDTSPYNGTTTTCEALWQGVPVVTLAGRVHASRVGASLLTNVGLADLVAADADAFVKIASTLAGDVARRRSLRMGLRAMMRSSPLCDARGLAAGLERLYRELFDAG
ncbi:MAG TPA: tetratricopeptide repeat protein [Minicystis sp.]|nr:tetratricopeptide repeat protein [Minicystis sp.]